MSRILKLLSNKKGEGYVDVAVKIIIGVVIGGVILAGLYLLFAGDGGVMDRLDTEIQGMMGYTQELRYERTYDEESGTYYLRYSYDGKHWNRSEMPEYSSTATVYGMMSNGSETDPIDAALIQDGKNYYVIASADGGITWTEKVSFTANAISHCYFGTSSQLPRGAGSFSGEKFVVRWNSGGSTYFTMVSDGKTWTKPTWSDMHLI